MFNHAFFRSSKNALSDITPAYSYLERVVKVIKIDEASEEKELVILMNGDLQKAVAYLENSSDTGSKPEVGDIAIPEISNNGEDGWKWRYYMAEQIAEQVDLQTYGVKGIYLFGSTNNCTAKLNSDIDLLFHIDGNKAQREALDTLLSGWSMALSEINYLKTGYKTNGLLDVHYVTDKDIKDKTSFAIKINSVFDPASPLRLRS